MSTLKTYMARLKGEPPVLIAGQSERRDDLPPPRVEDHGERRYLPVKPRVEYRDAENGQKAPRIVGHAAVFDQWTTLWEDSYGEMRECVRPKAFARAIREKQDVRCLFNHDSNFILGRTKSGTLTLAEDGTGLATETEPPPTQTVNDLVLVPMGREDIDGMSFAFSVARTKTRTETENDDGSVVIDKGSERYTIRWEGQREIIEREILDADLFDVSPVTFPAYEGTDCGLRARSVPDIESLVREIRSTVRRPAPQREEYRQRLLSAGVRLPAAPGRARPPKAE